MQGDEDRVGGRGGQAGQQVAVGVAQLGVQAGAQQRLDHLGARGQADLALEGQATGEHHRAQQVGLLVGGCAHGWSPIWSVDAGPASWAAAGVRALRPAAPNVPVSTASKVECRSSSASTTRASRRTPSRIWSGSG